jgi:hypothetical protein
MSAPPGVSATPPGRLLPVRGALFVRGMMRPPEFAVKRRDRAFDIGGGIGSEAMTTADPTAPRQDAQGVWWRNGPNGGAEYYASDGHWYAGQPPPAVPRAPAGPGYNAFAIVSLILGIVWVFGLGAILALIFGLIGLRQIERTGQGGRGLAIAGIVLGGVGIAGLVLFIVLAAIGSTVHCTVGYNC